MQNDRLNDMLERYGEVCTQKTAAKILSIAPRTVFTMLEQGRLRRIGHRVEVRSIAEYLDNAMQINTMNKEKRRFPRSNISEHEFFRASRTGNWAPRG